MRFGTQGFPLVLLSHRKQEFLETTLRSLRHYGTGITEVIVVDDSGDPEHHAYLDARNIGYSLVDTVQNMGYLDAMQVVFDKARLVADRLGAEHVLLWEEDFYLTRPTNLFDMARIMEHPANAALAQLNLQRQSCYGIERRFGYMESHQRRGYHLERGETYGLPWVRRRKPFTTNPSLIRREVLSTWWPHRDDCHGDAEGAMSYKLERAGWHFGWYGEWNTPSTKHVGVERKTGVGY